LIFREATAPAATLHAASLGVLAAIQPGLGLTDETRRRWSAALVEGRPAPLEVLGFCVVAHPLSTAGARAPPPRLLLTAREQKALDDLVRLRDLSDKLNSAGGVPERVVDLVEGLAPAAIWAFSILEDGPAGAAARQYLRAWRKVRPLLGGDDLLALGVPQGEKVGAMLGRLRAARLAGRLDDRQGEIDFVREALAREGDIDG
jgi:hypothetical protein